MPDRPPFSALCVAAPASGGGKTTLCVALMRALTRRGLTVQGFKCGPDYVDPTFHALASGRVSPNLDTWMMGREGVRAVWRRAADADAAVRPIARPRSICPCSCWFRRGAWPDPSRR